MGRSVTVGRCDGCGMAVAGGTAGCRSMLDDIGARAVLDARYVPHHRIVVDIDALQHPDAFCISAKSLMAHLTGLCAELDHPGHLMLLRSLQRSLDGSPALVRPPLPVDRGAVTIGDVHGAPDPTAYTTAVERWARSIWDAYAPLHRLARDHVARVLAGR